MKLAVPAIAHKHLRVIIYKLQHEASSQGCSVTPQQLSQGKLQDKTAFNPFADGLLANLCRL